MFVNHSDNAWYYSFTVVCRDLMLKEVGCEGLGYLILANFHSFTSKWAKKAAVIYFPYLADCVPLMCSPLHVSRFFVLCTV